VGELGARLREARESRGLSLDQVEEHLRIRRPILEALEEERYGDLPAMAYTRGIVRSYARYLGLSEDELLGQLEIETSVRPNVAPHEVLDEPLFRAENSRALWPRVFVVVMAALVFSVGGLYAYARLVLHEDPVVLLQERGWFGGGREAAAPPGAERPTQRPVSSNPTDGPAAAVPTLEATAVVEPSVTSTRTSLPSPTPRRTATPSPTPRPTSEAGGVTEDGIVVRATVMEIVWVRVTADGTIILEATLEPGQEYVWQATETLLLRLGNAGGIRLVVNDVDLGTPGASGQVVDLEFTPDNLPQP